MAKQEANDFMREFCEKDAAEFEEHANRLEKISAATVWPVALEILESEINHLRKMATLRRGMAKLFQ
jgi:hypothetical protein